MKYNLDMTLKQLDEDAGAADAGDGQHFRRGLRLAAVGVRRLPCAYSLAGSLDSLKETGTWIHRCL